VYSKRIRQLAMQLLDGGRSLSAVSTELGISRATIRTWREVGIEPSTPRPCSVCLGHPPEDPRSYAALLGYYLGDGYVSRQRSTYSLRVSCDARYQRIVEDVERLIVAVRGPGPVGRVRAPGCVVVCAYWNHWPCLFPQHGPGRKHERELTLTVWQRSVLDAHPAEFLRGLFHSDGCRVDNWASRKVHGSTQVYEYGRWQFVNHSEQIREWCTLALDALEIPWRPSNWKTISVSRREGVAALDELIGRKK
jgi:hypothetical protein